MFRSKVVLQVSGKNIERFIRRLASSKISILKIKYTRGAIVIKIYKEDYMKVIKINSTYSIDIVGAEGFIKYKKLIKINSCFIIFVLFGIFLLYYLSNLVFNVNVIHTNSETRSFIYNELSQYGISKYKLKKNFNELSSIKKKILEKYKDKIEWLEIEERGTEYIVRLELREILDKKDNNNKRNVVAKYDSIIKKIYSEKGSIVKEINNYVKKGDIIISGTISLNDDVKNVVDATGVVYGEVWLTTNVEYPYVYYEEKEIGKIKRQLVISFLNYDLFFYKGKKKIISENILVSNSILPIKLSIQNRKQVEVIDYVLTSEEAIKKASELACLKIKSMLDEDEHIVYQKDLKVNIKDDKIVLDSFFVVYRNITDYIYIEE